MASLILWTWVRVSSRSWWWTGKPGMLQSMGLQRVRHDWATELNWSHLQSYCFGPSYHHLLLRCCNNLLTDFPTYIFAFAFCLQHVFWALFLLNNFICLFLAVLGLHCCLGFSLVVVSGGYCLWACTVGFSLQRLLLVGEFFTTQPPGTPLSLVSCTPTVSQVILLKYKSDHVFPLQKTIWYFSIFT